MKKSHLTGKRFNLATLGDVHLGHPRTSTKKIVDVILEAFPGNRETADLDMILIHGTLKKMEKVQSTKIRM